MDGLSQHNRLNRIQSLKYPVVLNNEVKSLLSKSVMIASFLKYHSFTHSFDQQEESYFDELLTDLTEGKNIAEKYPDLKLGEIEPLWSVLISYAENLHQTSEQFNLRWHEYPEWYLQNVVGVKSLPAVGDKVWIAIENSGHDMVFIPRNTKFKVKNEKDKLYYRLTEDTEIHNVQLERFFLLKLQKGKQQGKVENPFENRPFVKSIRLTALDVEDNQIIRYRAEHTDVGVRITSPLLLLKEGQRSVKVIFYPRNKIWEDHLAKDVSTINNAFYLTISTEKGWEAITEYTAQHIEGNLHIDFTLPDSFASVTSCFHPVHHYTSRYPALNVCLNLNSEDYNKAALEKIQLSHVKLTATVKNVTNLQIYNELGKIDNSKPFAPFGINTEKGAWFNVGNYEVNIKETKYIDLNFEWEQLPETPLGLYYADYKKGITNHSFEVAVKYLSDFKWKEVRGKNIFSLFSTEDQGILATKNTIGKIDVDKMPIISVSENDYHYSLNSRNGFLNLTLKNPEMGFGEKVYRKIFTEQMMKNARKKNKYPSIQPPIQPVLKRITLDYYAEDVIDVRTHSSENQSWVSSIVPLDYVEANTEKYSENISFLPNLEERNLLLAFLNVKENTLLNLFFEVYPREQKDMKGDSLYQQREEIRHVKIYIGNPHHWERAPLSFMKKDETIGLLISGGIQLQFPQVISPDLYDSEGRLWIRIGYDDVDGVEFPAIKSVFLNAAKLEMIVSEDDRNSIVVNRKYGEVTEDTVIPGISKIKRISPFYNGRSAENSSDMLMRISEHAAHKGRAVTPKDYERLILHEFPDISKVKCITAPKKTSIENTVYLVVLPKTDSNERYPLTPPHLIFQIEKYIQNLTSSYVRAVRVINPVYEEVIIRCKIELKGYFSVKSRKLLAEKMNHLIAPWISDTGIALFGYSIDLEKIHDEIMNEFGTLISFSDFSAIRVEKDTIGLILQDFVYKKSGVLYENHHIAPSEGHGVLIPSDEHIFYWDDEIVPDSFGIDEMKIDKNFIISNAKKSN